MAADAINLITRALNERLRSEKLDFKQFMLLMNNVKTVLDGNVPRFEVDGIILTDEEIKAVTAFVRLMRQ